VEKVQGQKEKRKQTNKQTNRGEASISPPEPHQRCDASLCCAGGAKTRVK
jgi:hypothetical protein